MGRDRPPFQRQPRRNVHPHTLRHFVRQPCIVRQRPAPHDVRPVRQPSRRRHPMRRHVIPMRIMRPWRYHRPAPEPRGDLANSLHRRLERRTAMGRIPVRQPQKRDPLGPDPQDRTSLQRLLRPHPHPLCRVELPRSGVRHRPICHEHHHRRRPGPDRRSDQPPAAQAFVVLMRRQNQQRRTRRHPLDRRERQRRAMA